MSAIKITLADRWFSRCVRRRDNWTCQRCGSYAPEIPGHKRHECSHYITRGNWATRFDPECCWCACYGCHSYLEGRPKMHEQFMLERLGPYRLAALEERANSTTLGRRARREKAEIAAHYRSEFARMNDGEQFAGYL